MNTLYKDDFLSQINRFLDSNSSTNHGDFCGSRENVASRQMFKISYIENRQFKNNVFLKKRYLQLTRDTRIHDYDKKH